LLRRCSEIEGVSKSRIIEGLIEKHLVRYGFDSPEEAELAEEYQTMNSAIAQQERRTDQVPPLIPTETPEEKITSLQRQLLLLERIKPSRRLTSKRIELWKATLIEAHSQAELQALENRQKEFESLKSRGSRRVRNIR
jgi:hypothetical protein